MRILANDGIPPEAEERLKRKQWEVFKEKVKENVLGDFITKNGIDVLVVRSATKVSRQVIERARGLKAIIRGGIGMDNIDIEAAKEHGIQVYNTPGASVNSVAELVISLIMVMVRRTYIAIREMPEKGHTKFEELKKRLSNGEELQGKTIGIVGCGSIGRAVAQKSILLGMNVLISDPAYKTIPISIDVAGLSITKYFETLPLVDLLQKSDIVTLHVSYPPERGPLIGYEQIKLMKDGAYLINTSRGYCVDEKALLWGLESGKIGGCALDVFNNEPHPSEELLRHPNVVSTPHIGASTLQAQSKIWEEIEKILDNIKKIIPNNASST